MTRFSANTAILFPKCYEKSDGSQDALRGSIPLSIFATKHLKIGYFCVHESGLPDFGRTWTQNG